MVETIDIVIPAHNSSETIHKPLGSSVNQKLPKGWNLNIIIVDDGSTDSTAGIISESYTEKQIRFISHSGNRGRSAARNTGWRAGQGSYVVFLDSDCRWLTDEALSAHLETLESGSDVSIGSVTGDGNIFWDLYQRKLQSSREKDFYSGNFAAFTSANLALRRIMLEKTDGFDEGYRHYGFEDRDFLLRLLSVGARIGFTSKGAVVHFSALSLGDVCKKMEESGQYSSRRFYDAHPEYYCSSSYGKIDCRLHGFPLTALAAIFSPLIPWLADAGDRVIRKPCLPFSIKRVLVRMIAGLAYLAGSYRDLKKK